MTKPSNYPVRPYRTKELDQDLRDFYSLDCSHEKTTLCRAVVRNGSVQYRRQCLLCGYLLGNPISKHSISGPVPEMDKALIDRTENARKNDLEAIYQKHIAFQDKRSVEYAEYLKTPAWREKRQRVLDRAGYKCEGCRTAPATQVHHLTYEHIFNELLFELVAICDACHDLCHPLEDDIADESEAA